MPTVKIKRLFRFLPWLLAILLGLFFLALLIHELDRQRRAWEQQLAQGKATQEQLVSASRHNLVWEARLIAELMAEDEAIIHSIRAAAQTRSVSSSLSGAAHQVDAALLRETRMDELRGQAALALAPYWDKLKADQGRQLTLYLAPAAEAFYRAHHPQRYGDLSDDVRPMVMEVFRTGKAQVGLDVGRHGAGYRAIIPIFAGSGADNIVAAIELGLGLIDESLHTEGGAAVLINPSVLDDLVWVRGRDNLNAHRNSRLGQWLLQDYSGELARAWSAAGLLPDPEAGIAYQRLRWEGQEYVFYTTPVQDFVGEKAVGRTPLVAILSWQNISTEFGAYLAARNDALAKWLLALFFTEAAVLVLLRLSRNYVRTIMVEHNHHLERERDISEEARQQLTLALESGESGFWEWDITSDKAKFSPQWKKICKILPGQATFSDTEEWLTRIHPNDKMICQRDMVRHLKGETPMYESEYRLRGEDGNYHWIYTRGKVVARLADGKAAQILGVYTDVTARKEAEVTILRQQAALRALNEIAALPAVEPEEQLRRALALGASYLGLPIGIMSEIRGNQYTVQVQVSPPGVLQDKDQFDLGITYCRLTLDDGDVVAIDAMGESQYRGHPCYENFKLESYIGAPLTVDGKDYGTLSFSSPAPRYHRFDALDKDFIRLLARWAGVTIERWQQFSYQQELLQRFRKLSERLPGFLYQYQLRPDGTAFFPYASAGIENIFGVRAEQALLNAAPVFKRVHPDDQEALQSSIQLSAAQLSVWSTNFRVNHPRGELWVRGDAKPELLPDDSVLWHGFFSDITHEKAAELELQANSALQQAIFDAASVAIISVNTTGVIQVFNQGAETMLGYRADEVIGHTTPDIFHLPQEMVERAAELSRELKREIALDFEVFIALAELHKVEEREWTYVRKDGSHFPVLLTVSALRDAAGTISGYVGIARDITELKRIERMKNEFIATVSHELRTPLTAISGALGLVVNGAAGILPESMSKMLHIAHKNSERLNFLVNDLLDMEKLVAGKAHFDLQLHQLQPLVEQAIEAISAYADPFRVAFELTVQGREAWVYVDPLRIAQVLANYLSNAAKFSPPNSVVQVNINADVDIVRVSVSDSGIGIPKDFYPHIFGKFSQVDATDARQKGGTGLGLAICKELIERMDGTVGFESVLGEGSTFYFDLKQVR